MVHAMSEQGTEKFFRIARERYQIKLNRDAGLPKPWTKDKIFQTEYFCNVFRTDDKTTKWFWDNILKEVAEEPVIALIAIVAFRWFNKIETWETILKESSTSPRQLIEKWNSEWITQILSKGTPPWVTGAYIIKTPDGKDKVQGVLWCIERFIENLHKRAFKKILYENPTMEEAANILKISPYLGNFMSWQICSDARQTILLNNAPDKDTWAMPGPGSTRGIGRVFYGDVNKFRYGSTKDDEQVLELMRELRDRSRVEEFWPQHWSPLAVIDISHWLCEVDKYYRAEEGGRMKRKYNAIS